MVGVSVSDMEEIRIEEGAVSGKKNAPRYERDMLTGEGFLSNILT